jgi:hypothetical protein
MRPIDIYMHSLDEGYMESAEDICHRLSKIWALNRRGSQRAADLANQPSDVAHTVMKTAPNGMGELCTWMMSYAVATCLRLISKQKIPGLQGDPVLRADEYNLSYSDVAMSRELRAFLAPVDSSASTAAASAGADVAAEIDQAARSPISSSSEESLGEDARRSSSNSTVLTNVVDPMLSVSAAEVVTSTELVVPARVAVQTTVELSREQEESLLYPELAVRDSRDENLSALYDLAADLATAPIARFEGLSKPPSFSNVVFSPPPARSGALKRATTDGPGTTEVKKPKTSVMPELMPVMMPDIELSALVVRDVLRKQRDRDWHRKARAAKKGGKLVVRLPNPHKKRAPTSSKSTPKKKTKTTEKKSPRKQKTPKKIVKKAEDMKTVPVVVVDPNNNKDCVGDESSDSVDI